MSLFETSLEKIGRLMSQQWGINVVFEGTEAKTDGKTITLPATGELSQEIMEDLNGLLDSQAARVKYTDFKTLNKAFSGKGKAFHEQLFKAAEQNRAERNLIEQYPGCKYNLDPLNEKVRDNMKEEWDKLPWPVRLVRSIKDNLDGTEPELDSDIKDMYKRLEPQVDELMRAKSTEEVLQKTSAMTRKILEYLDEPEDPESDGDEGEDEKDKTKSKSKGKAGGKGDKADGESEPGEGSESDEDSDSSDESESDGSSDSKSEVKEKTGKPSKDEMKDASDDLMDDSSKWNDFDMSAEDLVNDSIKDEISPGGKRPKYTAANRPHIPATTRFDQEIDLNGKGDAAAYLKLKQDVQALVAPIRRELEAALKVAENARWRQERERGMLNTRSLSKLIAEPGYRKPFKEMTRTEVNNVAVQILVDMSGSMGGRMETAKSATIVLAEALKELNIPFEVTGFHSQHDDKFQKWSYENKVDHKIYNRHHEALRKYIFKRFDSVNLTGIAKLYVGSQNPDGEAVRWAANRLSQQKAKRKILLVLSDGAPCADGDASILARDLKQAVTEITKHGMEVVGVGIQTAHVKEFYPDYVVVNKIQDLPTETMNKLSKLILKGVSK